MDKLLLLIFSLGAISSKAQITYYQDIAPIINNHCASCHQEGDIGPMPLTTYDEVAAYASMIKYVTETKLMPPFKANYHKVLYDNERSISEQDIAIITEWIKSGLQEGTPMAKTKKNEADKIKYDLSLCMSEAFEHYGIYYDQYQAFVIPIPDLENNKVKEVIFEPGNKEIVRAANISISKKGSAKKQDEWDPRYGFYSYGELNFDTSLPLWHTWMPHTDSQNLQSNEVKILPKDSDLILHIHYGPFGETQLDSSCIHFNFTENKNLTQLQNVPLIQTYFLKDSFLISAEEKTRYSSEFYLPESATLKSITPLSHLLSTTWEVIAVRPDGSTEHLLSIEDWDFHWKEKFIFKKPINFSKGTRIICTTKYDNRSANTYNPSSPPHSMTKGPHMFDENFICYFEFQTESTKAQIYKPFTNSDQRPEFLKFDISESGKYEISLFNLNSLEPKEIIEKYFHKGQHNIQNQILPNQKGRYLISIKQKDEILDSWYFSIYK